MLFGGGLALLILGGVLWLSPATSDQQAVPATRQQLQAQSFKTDLSEFNLTTAAL